MSQNPRLVFFLGRVLVLHEFRFALGSGLSCARCLVASHFNEMPAVTFNARCHFNARCLTSMPAVSLRRI